MNEFDLTPISEIAKELQCSTYQASFALNQAMYSFKLELFKRGLTVEDFFETDGRLKPFWRPMRKLTSQSYIARKKLEGFFIDPKQDFAEKIGKIILSSWDSSIFNSKRTLCAWD